MQIEFEKALDGIVKFINRELVSGMNVYQEIATNMIVGWAIKRSEGVKNYMINNGLIRAFCVIDSEGKMPVDEMLDDLKKEITKKGRLTINIRGFGPVHLSPADIDKLKNDIYGGVMNDQAY